MVGRRRLELPTSPLSGARSNQLSYRPPELMEAAKPAPTENGYDPLYHNTLLLERARMAAP